MKLGTRFETFPYAGLAVRQERLLDIIHLDPPGIVARLPEQPVDEHRTPGGSPG